MSRGYWIVGDDGEALDYVEYGDEHLHGDEIELGDYEPPKPVTPLWAKKAGKIMFAILDPTTKSAGWQAFEIVDALAKTGQRFAQQVRQGIARIARSLQSGHAA